MTTMILVIALVISFFTDVKQRKILNIVTLPAILIGIISNTVTSGFHGLLFSLLGVLTGFALLFIPYVLNGMAAGDLKLVMAIGALKGSAFVFGSFLYIALFGGIIALIILLFQKDFMNTLKRMVVSAQFRTLDSLSKKEYHHAFPYGVAIVLGTFSYYGMNLL
ncbi:prepilin peptidase [Bacillus sp. PS06]|uniref:A24 family peptidase n=1 Tax=Bacillus sp. PS06 TaxID=2764176 RepID=UPI00177C418D|nr:A24 family peptidase [Bacillus sp. PS06]MBD8069122.1 prepilin peptidase [Bacillus sp. PS06]